MTAIALGLALYAAILAVLAWLIWRAPEGYETPERGFVFGPIPPAALDEPDFDGDGNDLKSVHYSADRLADRDGLAPVSAPFHSPATSAGGAADHA